MRSQCYRPAGKIYMVKMSLTKLQLQINNPCTGTLVKNYYKLIIVYVLYIYMHAYIKKLK